MGGFVKEVKGVVPIGSGSVWGDNEELRYALRSWEANLIGLGDIYVVGESLPKWSKGLNLLYFKEDNKLQEWKEFRIFSKVLAACKESSVSEDFLFLNDDHFITKPIVASEFPYHYREEDMIDTVNKSVKNEAWKTTIRNTREHLINKGLDVKMFDTHCPIIYNKFQFELLDMVDWSKPHGYGIKSLYANTTRISGSHYPDGKLFPSEVNKARIEAKIANRPYFSTSPIVPFAQQEIIMNLFPEKSRFEI